MGCIFAVVALLFPRIAIVILWLFTNWFDGVYSGILIPLLGVIFLPVTMLWYSVVVNSFGGDWNLLTVLGMIVAVAIDLGSFEGGRRSRRR